MNLKILTWNMKCGGSPEAWDYLFDLKPDVALLQEAAIPEGIEEKYTVFHRLALSRSGRNQPWGSAVLVDCRLRATGEELRPRSRPWISTGLEKFGGSFVAADVATPQGNIFFLSCHSPAWNLPVADYGIPKAAQDEIRGSASPNDIWGTDFIWEYLRDELAGDRQFVVGGDFNCSVIFDETWGSGNQEFIDSMASLGLVDCVRKYHPNPRSTPTFKNPKGGKVEHQLDYLWTTAAVAARLRNCEVGSKEVFERKLSDHLPIIASLSRES